MVVHLARIARSRRDRYQRMIGPGSPRSLRGSVGGRMVTPISGANNTATSQETNSAIATTANMENVYSPAALLAKPMGTNPATVTSVPVSIGKAVDV